MTKSIALAGWHIAPDHSSHFVRTFRALPDGEYPLDYLTQERLGERIIKATYPARLEIVRVRYQWEPSEGGHWWGQATGDIALINEKTGERYTKGWRKNSISEHFASWETDNAPDYIRAVLDATHPHTTVTVTEKPAWT